MTWAGSMRRCASRVAMRRISWVDQSMRTGSDSVSLAAGVFGAAGGSHDSGSLSAWRTPASPARPDFNSLAEKVQLYQRSSFLGTTLSVCGNTCLVCWHLLKDWRQGKSERAADRVDARAWCGAQQRAAAILFDLDGAQIEQIVDDALPFRHAAAGQSVEQRLAQHQSQKRAKHVPADRGIGAMEHRAGGKHGLCREEALFNHQQVAVAQHHGQCRHRQTGFLDAKVRKATCPYREKR